MKKLVLVLVVIILTTGCAYYPKDFKKDYPNKSITDSIAVRYAGKNETSGWINIVFGTLCGAASYSYYRSEIEKDYRERNPNPPVSLALLSIFHFIDAVKCYDASKEWEMKLGEK